MTKALLDPKLWTPRPPEETRALYADWAASYDADVTGAGYATPARLAKALADICPDLAAPILDFGCGTGLSGMALVDAGFGEIHGTDITPEMLARAEARGLYKKLWLSPADNPPPRGYTTIAAIGVVSLGAAPASMLACLLDHLPAKGLLGFSYNDATLGDESYMDALDAARIRGKLLHDSYGPHLTGKQMGASIYVLQKS